ncbi:hypothetical protein M432DRAFT_650661 [Thermoascus aurantiacus ATCC 26904]
MSYLGDNRRRRGGFGASGRRTALGYWVPLVLTVGIAAVGLAAWIWSERNDDDGDEDFNKEHRERDGEDFPPGEPGAEDTARTTATDIRGQTQTDDGSVIARVQGALRSTPSPQEIFEGASRRVAAGISAAGALVGGALTSVREEGRGDFEDHSRWSEEVESRNNAARATAAEPTMSGALPARGAAGGQAPLEKKKKKTVAIVVSSVSSHDALEESTSETSEHVSILSHLPEHIDADTTRVFILIYAPGLKHSISRGSPPRTTASVSSSYSNIGTEEAEATNEPAEAEMSTIEPRAADDVEGATPLFKTLYSQAQNIVEKETMIMPFSTPTGHVHILRHLSPEIVYIQESLTGNEGENVQLISGWVRQVVVVVGDEGGRGDLIDSEDESAVADKGEKWWQKEGVTGLGKRIDVVDGLRAGEDWRRRVSGYD